MYVYGLNFLFFLFLSDLQSHTIRYESSEKMWRRRLVRGTLTLMRKLYIVFQSLFAYDKLLSSFLTENDNFVVWEMFPGKDSLVVSDSEEEKDFYFSEDNWLHYKNPDLFFE